MTSTTNQPRPRRVRTRAAAVTAALAVLASATPALGATTRVGPAKQTVDQAVAAALYRMDKGHLVRDNSKTTACMGSSPVPLTYRGDRIVVRTDLPKKRLRLEVTKALAAIGSPGTVTKIKKIKLPAAGPAPQAKPVGVAGVTIKTESHDQVVRIVGLTRYLRTVGILASPDHALSPSSGPTGMWPNGYPEPTAMVPTPRGATLGDRVDVWVYDVGVPPLAQGARAPHLSKLRASDDEVLDAQAPAGVVDRYYGGHTLAIADVIATLAPGAFVKAARITDNHGVATDFGAAVTMAKTLRKAAVWPDVIVNAFGSPACDVDPKKPLPDMVPLALQAVDEAITARGGTVVVASAGNRSTDRPFYPAAFAVMAGTEAVSSVGALDATKDADGNVWTSASRSAPAAWFSNYGPWVTLWAPGYELSTRHVIGLRFTPTGPLLNGQAIVSGTSFAGPYVAALLAEVIASDGVSPEVARTLLTSSGMTCSVAVGSGVAVALTSMTDSATTPPGVGLPAEC